MVEQKLRCYFVCNPKAYDGCGVAVVTTTAKKAKQLAFRTEPIKDEEWIDLRVNWNKKANIEGLEDGHIFIDDKEVMDAMYRGIYGATEYMTCPRCGTEDTFVYEVYENVFCCGNCEEGLTKEDINNPYVKKEEVTG